MSKGRRVETSCLGRNAGIAFQLESLAHKRGLVMRQRASFLLKLCTQGRA